MLLNETIKRLLSEKNKTQAELAEYIGVRQNTVSDWFNKDKSPSSAYIYRICDFFGVSFDYLFTGKDCSMKTNLSEGERDLLTLIHNLTPKEQQRVIGVVENYLGRRPATEPIKPELPTSVPSLSDGIREYKQEQLLEALNRTAKSVK